MQRANEMDVLKKFTRPLTLQHYGFTNFLILLRVRRRPIINIFGIRIPRLYLSHTTHVFTSKIHFDEGFILRVFQPWKKCFVIVHVNSQYYDGWKINLETKICGGNWNLSRFDSMPLTWILTRKLPYLFLVCVSLFFSTYNRFSCDFVGSDLH